MRSFARRARIEKRLAAIANDRRSGASELAVRALLLFYDAKPTARSTPLSYRRDVRRLGERVGRLRPAMAPVAAIVERVVFDFDRGAADAKSADEAFQRLREVTLAIERQFSGRLPAAARKFVEHFGHWQRLLTISYSSQVLAALAALPARTLNVVICESRPALEGRRLARSITPQAQSVTVITEAQCAVALEQCDGVLFGCDAILADGSIVNKCGSHILALAAREKNKPVVVIGDHFKFATRAAFEEHDGAEVWRNAPRGITVMNQYFELVPGRLIDAVVLEDGVYEAQEMRLLCEAELGKRGKAL